MDNMKSFVKRASDKCGFVRESFIEDNIPTLPSNILVLPFFGNISSCSILSQFILRRYKELRTNKYLILASWPGCKHLFPYVDEYWSPSDTSSVLELAAGCDDFFNNSNILINYSRFLNNHFENVLSWDDLSVYYNFGITPKFWESFRMIKAFLPDVPSISRLSEDFRFEMDQKQGKKIAIFPVKKMRSWQNGKNVYLPVHRNFWISLVNRLLRESYVPVVYQNWFTYDLSMEFTDKCIWLTYKNIDQILSGLRSSDCVLDIHSGISRLAALGRCPSIVVDEHQRYVMHKEYELDDLTPTMVPKQYIFSFSTRLMTGGEQEWNLSLIDGIMSRLNKWLPTLNKEFWGPTIEMYDDVSYDAVRRHKNMRLGVKFIRKY